jgi:hypothetical protein
VEEERATALAKRREVLRVREQLQSSTDEGGVLLMPYVGAS